MSTLHPRYVLGALFLAALVAGPLPASGQMSARAIQAEANRLHDAALPVGTQPVVDVVLAARQHGEAASLRLPTDPRAVQCHRIQANLLYVIKEYAEASHHLELAAALAIGQHDHATAARIYNAASGLALEQGHAEDAAWFASEALRLSPRLANAVDD